MSTYSTTNLQEAEANIREAMEAGARLHTKYTVQVTRKQDGTGGWHTLSGFDSRDDCEDFIKHNQQLRHIPDEFKRIVKFYWTDWIPDA